MFKFSSHRQLTKRAIEFCEEHADNDLWNQLLEFARSRPECIDTLLTADISEHLAPRRILGAIAPRLRVPHLKEALLRLLRDYSTAIEVHERCRQVLTHDWRQLLHAYLGARAGPLLVREFASPQPSALPTPLAPAALLSVSAPVPTLEPVCHLCSKRLYSPTPSSTSAETAPSQQLELFGCGHMFHTECLRSVSQSRVPPSPLRCSRCSSAALTTSSQHKRR